MNVNRSLLAMAVIAVVAMAGTANSANRTVPGDHATLEEALAAIVDGDTVTVGAGNHAINFSTTPGVSFSLIGAEGPDETIITCPDSLSHCLSVDLDGGALSLKGLTFDRTVTEQRPYSLIVKRGELALDNCRFLGGAAILCDSVSGVIGGSKFVGCFDGVTLMNSPLTIDGNEFTNIDQYAIKTRGSTAAIYGNTFDNIASASVLISGKRRYPVVGGSREHANVFLRHTHLYIANHSRNEINAQFNYWGPVLSSTMEYVGYPGNLAELFDKWDSEDRAAGMIDFRNWLTEDPRSSSEGGGDGFPVSPLLVLLAVVVLGGVAFAVLRR